MKKRILSVLLASAMVASLLAGCGGSDSKSDAAKTDKAGEKQLAVQIGPDPETIDPALNSASDGGNMIITAFEGLLMNGEDDQIIEGCAEDWGVSEDGLTWTFKLREGLKWSDGTDLTAEDFVYSWKRVCDPALAAPYAETVLNMVVGYDDAINGDLDALGVTAVDDLTLEVKLSSPCSYFENLVAFPTLYPVQKATVEENGDGWAVNADTYITNGAFYISDWVPGEYILMSKNENYWNADAVKLDSIKFALMEDSNAAYSAYQNGELQLIKDVPTEEVPSLQGQDDFYVDPIIGTYYISVNIDKEPFNNADVRKALSLAIDRDYVANTIMQGTYSPAYNFMGPGWLDTDGSVFMDNANNGEAYLSDDYEANVEEAKKLLEKAGYGDGLAISYKTNDSGYHVPLAEYLQQAWAEIGVTLTVETVEWSSFTPDRRAGSYEVARNGWVGDYTDPSNMLELLYSTNGNNDGNYNNPEFDAAIDLSRTTTDLEERSQALHTAEDILMEDTGCIPVAYYNDFWLQSSEVTGLYHSAMGKWVFRFADIAE